jgi:hypothetical protein
MLLLPIGVLLLIYLLSLLLTLVVIANILAYDRVDKEIVDAKY